MVDYYKILGVKRSATRAEIRSAYRKRAKVLHPDFHGGSPKKAREFAVLSKAYHLLMDPHERAHYDERFAAHANKGSGASILHSSNPHAQRARNLAVQARWDRIVDEVLERDRKDNVERQRAVFTTVSLFLSTFILAMIKPHFWEVFDYAGRAVVVALGVIGIWHLTARLKEYFEHYTYAPKPIQDSIMQEEEPPAQPFSRSSAYAFLILGYALSVGIGLLVGWRTQEFFAGVMMVGQAPVATGQSNVLMYSPAVLLLVDLILCPPIAVLIVDSLQTLAARIE